MSDNANITFDDMYYADVPVGQVLLSFRERYGQSLDDIEQALHIRISMIYAIEIGDFDSLPGRTYAIGFVRAYSEYLGLDAERVVKLYKSQANASASNMRLEKLKPKKNEQNIPHIALIAASLVIFLVLSILLDGQNNKNSLYISDVPASAKNTYFTKNSSVSAVDTLNQPSNLYY